MKNSMTLISYLYSVFFGCMFAAQLRWYSPFGGEQVIDDYLIAWFLLLGVNIFFVIYLHKYRGRLL